VTGTLEETLEELCEEISVILASSSLEEAIVNKPGNASRKKDIKSVSYMSIQESATYLLPVYRRACMMGYFGKHRPLFSLLEPNKLKKLLGTEFSLFGTAISLLPVSFASIQSSSICELRRKLTQIILNLDEKEGESFVTSLKSINPSYKGKLMGEMDIDEIKGKSLYEILLYSSDFDEIAKNMTHGYYLTYLGYQALREWKCVSFDLNVRRAFFKVLSHQPDTLIMKKYGSAVSLKISEMALKVSECPTCEEINSIDEYMLKHGFNPGSTADIIASSIAFYHLERWFEDKASHGIWLPLPKGCSRAGK